MAAFPTISDADTKSGTVASNTLNWTLTYPSNIAANDLLLAFIGSDGSNVFSATGWTAVQGATSTPVSLQVLAKIAAGTETGTFTANTDVAASEQGGWHTFRVPAASWFGSGIPGAGDGVNQNDGNGLSLSVPATGVSNIPNPPNLNPANWATEDVLWLAAIAVDTSRTISVYPYATRNTADVSGGAGGATLGLCTTTSTAANVDPGTFTVSSSDDWAALTVAVRPAAAAGNATPTPSTLALTTATFAAILALTVTPSTLALTSATFAPKLSLTVTPSTLSQSISAFAPTATITLNAFPSPSTVALITSTFAPRLDSTLTPSTASLSTATFAPSLLSGTAITPDTVAITTSTFAPRLDETLTPSTKSLIAATFAPKLAETLTPSTAALTVGTFAPRLSETVTPSTVSVSVSTFALRLDAAVPVGSASLSTNTFAPSLTETLTPPTVALTTGTFAPSLSESLTPQTLSLTTGTFLPSLAHSFVPEALSLVTNTFAPTATVSASDVTVTPDVYSLTLTTYAPTIWQFSPKSIAVVGEDDRTASIGEASRATAISEAVRTAVINGTRTAIIAANNRVTRI